MATLAGVLASEPPARIIRLSSHEVTLTCAGDVRLGYGTYEFLSAQSNGLMSGTHHGTQEGLDNGRKLVRVAIV